MQEFLYGVFRIALDLLILSFVVFIPFLELFLFGYEVNFFNLIIAFTFSVIVVAIVCALGEWFYDTFIFHLKELKKGDVIKKESEDIIDEK